MASFALLSNSTASQTLGTFETGFIASNVTLATNGDSIFVTSANDVTILGTAYSSKLSAIYSTTASDIDIVVGEAGAAIGGGDSAINLSGSGGYDIVNYGTITTLANTAAIFLTGGSNTVFNSGSISAASGGGIALFGAAGETTRVDNAATGIIGSASNNAAIVANPSVATIEIVHNAGGIFGDVRLGNGADHLRNDGAIYGDVRLGAGSDVFRGVGFVDGTVFGEGGNDVIRGGPGDDVLDGGGGNDSIVGGAGEDLLIGGPGVDRLTGGADADTFAFLSPADLGNSGATRDVITDFRRGPDVIDLSALDAKTGAGNQAFTFIGSAAFSQNSGELRFTKGATETIISGDFNGDAVGDFKIALIGSFNLLATDFIL